MHHRNHASRVNNYARREYFMPRQNLCITRRFHASSNLYIARRLHTSLEFMHHEKNPCLVEISHIARRFHASLKVMHREKIRTSREFTYRGKIFIPRKRTYTDKGREIVYPKNNIYPSASTASFIFDKKQTSRKASKMTTKRHQYRINIYLFILTSSIEYIEDYIAKHKA